jgi:hypothetical protein
LDLKPDIIQTLKPLVCRRLIANLAPDSLLNVQSRLITGQVLQVQSHVALDKELNFLSPMPSGSIHIEPNRITTKSLIEVPQTLKESFPIALRPLHHSPSSKQRSHPSKQIQPLPMLARRWNTQPLSHLRPPNPEPRMQCKTRFILKDDRLPRSQGVQFFLTPGEIAWPLRCGLEGTNTQPVSVDNPTDASRTEPAEPSGLFQNDASGGPLMWGRPNELGSAQIPKGTALSGLPILDAPWELSEPDAPVALLVPEPSAPVRSPCASRDSSSDASSPGPRQSIPDADPPVSAVKPLSLFPQRLPELAESWTIDALGWPPDELTLRMGFS